MRPPLRAPLCVVLVVLPQLAAVEVAADAKGNAEEVNPFVEQGDSSQECYAWAADGQCKLNPQHMLSSCKYSCWEWFRYRREQYPNEPIDKMMDCNSWSNSGECGKNPDYMRANCPESCKEKGYDPPPTPPTPPKKKPKKKPGTMPTSWAMSAYARRPCIWR